MAKIDPKNIYISIDGTAIQANEFGDAEIEINTGGDTSEVKKGKCGAGITVVKYDKIDNLTFTVFAHTSASYRLEQMHSIAKQFSVIVKDMNPAQQRAWTSSAAQVKGFDAVTLTDGKGYAFTIECEDDFKQGIESL